jgi:NitT/TauT family transport system permease protein
MVPGFFTRFAARARPLLLAVLLLALWEAAVRGFALPLYLLPPPSLVFAALVEFHASLLEHSLVTAREIVAGYVLAVVVAVPLAVLISQSKLVAETVYPLLVFSQVIPKVALAPLFIIWFGFGFMPKLLLTFLLCFFPVVVAGIAGFKSLDDDVLDFARSTGATPWRLFTKIRLPHALPSIFVGLKVAATLAVVGAIVAEFVASDRGLGYILMIANGDLNTVMAFAVLTILAVIGLALYYGVDLAERLVIPWHASQRDPLATL